MRTIRRSILYGLGYTIFLKVGFYLAVVMVFGSIFAPERILLFYEAIQAIHLSAYLQRVDTAFVIMWLTGGLISAIILQFLSLTLLCDPFKIKDIRPMIPIIVLISATFSLMPDSVVSTIEINNTFVYYVSTTFICLNFLFTSIGYYRFRRNKLCAGVTK